MYPRVHTLESGRPGPRVVILAGVHGDEDDGIVVAQRLVRTLPDRLLAGTVVIVPLAHPAAAVTYTRVSPLDGGNLARVFPGSPTGGPTERIAAFLTDVIEGADLLIDLHSAGDGFDLIPFCGYIDAPDDVGARSKEAATAFGTDVLWAHAAPPPPGRSVTVAYERGIPAIYGEARGGHMLIRERLDEYEACVLRCLGRWGVVEEQAPRAPLWRAGGEGNLDAGIVAGAAGRFVSFAALGEDVVEGETIGVVLDEDGREAAAVRAPAGGRIIVLRRRPRVRADDVVALLATPELEDPSDTDAAGPLGGEADRGS